MSQSTFTFDLQFRNTRYKNASAGLKALSDRMGKSRQGFAPALSKELDIFLRQTMSELAAKHSTAYPSGTTTNTLSKRSGGLVKALKKAPKVTSATTINGIRAELSLPRKYSIHEKGGIIRPKKSKYLTVPLEAALRSNGTPRKPKARDWKNTFVAKSKKGNLIIFQNTSEGIVPLYVLKKSVKIPPRMGMSKHVKERLPRFIDNAITAMYDSMLT